jgi:hypothetical protein
LVAALHQQWLVWALPRSIDTGPGVPLVQAE